MPLDATAEQIAQRGLDELLRMRLVRQVLVKQPAAGADWAQLVPGGSTWELLSVFMLFATSGVAGNRAVRLRILDADSVIVNAFDPGATVAATATQRLGWYAGLGATVNVSQIEAPLPSPPAVLLPGWQLVTATGSLDVADQFSAIVLVVRIWSETAIVQNAQLIGTNYDSLTIDK